MTCPYRHQPELLHRAYHEWSGQRCIEASWWERLRWWFASKRRPVTAQDVVSVAPQVREAPIAPRRFGPYNYYRGSCGHYVITQDMAPGTTPMLIPCGKCPDQKSMLRSAFYPDPDHWPAFLGRTVTHEWVAKPVTRGLRRKQPALARYLEQGGLHLRAVPPRPIEWNLPSRPGPG